MRLSVLLFVLGCFCLPYITYAQDPPSYYSYLQDRMFLDPLDLEGYQFVPGRLEVPAKDVANDFRAGAYSFGISRNNLFVRGGDIEGLYNIKQINTTDFGYRMSLLNARNPSETGHLKVILDKNRFADALIFRRSAKDDERIFFLPIQEIEEAREEAAYFTDLQELEVSALDSLWTSEPFRPFFRYQKSPTVQQRLQMADSVYVRFEKIVTITEKIKKPKKNKKANKAEDELLADSVDTNAVDTLAVDKKIKIDESYFVIVHYTVFNDAGQREAVEKRWELKAFKEDVDKKAQGRMNKYRIILETNKGSEMYLFLDENRKATAFEYENSIYYVRGWL